MTKKRKIELLELRVMQLEEQNQLLLDSSEEGVKKRIMELECAIDEYNGMIEEMYDILEQFRIMRYSLCKDAKKKCKKFLKKIRLK